MAKHPGPGWLRAGPLALALSLAAPGCYTYTQASPAAVPPGSSVRVRVDPRVPLKVGEVALPDGGRVIRGKLLPGSTPDTLLCSVALSSSDPFAARGIRGTVLIPLAEVERLEVRRLQKGRTVGIVTAGALLGLVVVNWAFDIALPNEDGGGDAGGGDNMRGWRLQFGW